jgi:hypothetical protein
MVRTVPIDTPPKSSVLRQPELDAEGLALHPPFFFFLGFGGW